MIAIFAAVVLAAATGAKGAAYEQMAPLGRYLMLDRQAEIQLARSAAPAAISHHASILVLGRHGYETATKGSNGFTCLVERSWMSPFDSPEFWNWHIRGPICYNPAASSTVLRDTFFRTNLALAGATKAQMLERVQAAAGKELPAPALGSMSYMMSKSGYLSDSAGNWTSHLMFYGPKDAGANAGASWGADVAGSPVVFNSSAHVMPEETIFMIPVAHWSDGTNAPSM